MIAFIWKLIVGGLWKPILAIFGALGLYVKGRSDAKAKADLKDLKAHKQTTERMQDADAAMGDDPAVLRDSLRKRDPNVR
jgi:hypothetical protein